jgi:hypothetical protein
MAVAPKCFPLKRTRSFRTDRPRASAGSRTTIAQEALATEGSAVPAIRDWNAQALDAFFGVVQDATANPKARRKAALKIAESGAGAGPKPWRLVFQTADIPHFDFSNLCNHVRKALAIWKNVVASDGMSFGLANYAGFGNA